MTGQANLIKIFEYALNQEYTGLSFFEASLQRLGIGAAQTAFRRLIHEEEKHIAFLSKIIADIKNQQAINFSDIAAVALEQTDYFDSRAKSEFLQQCVEGSMVPDVTVFNTAWLIEKDLSEFYDAMAAKTDGQAKEALKLLADWERGHEKFFRLYRDKISEVYR